MRVFLSILILLLMVSCKQRTKHEKGHLPDFDFLLTDSVTHLTTDMVAQENPVALLYFSPDCEHCQEETATILKNMNELKKIHFYFITNDPLERTKEFSQFYGLYKHSNITVCWDNQFYFPRRFKGAFPPYLVVYDKDKRQQGVYEGGLKGPEMIALANKL